MLQHRKYVLTIAGFDPSGGAGLLADIKTFEQHKVYGLSICTASTLQTENTFLSIKWSDLKDVLNALDVLLNSYPVHVIKTGIVPSFDFLHQLVSYIKKHNSEIKIIVDPILKSSTGFNIQNVTTEEKLSAVLENIFLITPNVEEATLLSPGDNPETAAKKLSRHCNVLLKGGHNKTSIGVDILFMNENSTELYPSLSNFSQKHGSGCVLSAAIAANVALGLDVKTSCINAKKYVEKFLSSNGSLIGYHHV